MPCRRVSAGSLDQSVRQSQNGNDPITLTATLRSDDAFLHEPAIVRVKWRGGSLVFGSKDIPALLTLTEEETLVATCKYQTSIEAVKG